MRFLGLPTRPAPGLLPGGLLPGVLLTGILLTGALLSGGCSRGGDGVDAKAVDAARAPLAAAAKRSGGDWERLTPDERKLFLDRGHGNEPAARGLLRLMANRPDARPKER